MESGKKSVRDVDLKEKRIFLRLDLNIPIKDGVPTDISKINESIPTIKYIIEQNPKMLVIGTHIGRPKNGTYQSTAPIIKVLKEILHVDFVLKTLEDEINEKCVLLENLRIYREEEVGFGNYFSNNFDFVVVDAFATLHRSSKSIIDTRVPTICGFLVEKELKKVKNLCEVDFYIFGGAKAEDKLKIIIKMKDNSSALVGVLSISCYKKIGLNMGMSKFDENIDLKRMAILPEDYVVKKGDKYLTKAFVDIKDDEYIVDIGNATIKVLQEAIKDAKTIFWNGPPGIFEEKCSSEGTRELIRILAEKVEKGCKVYIGGGDTIAAVTKFSKLSKFTETFTAGGAMMTLLAGEEMPGLDAILDK